MRIVSLHLKNIKSHRDKELTFSPGINVLSGANGSGKSTIFEAIGYALFGVSAQDFVSKADRFLTIGTKKGEVAVIFEPAPGELFRVTRTVGTAGKWLLAKESGGSFEIEEHANAQETEQRIAELLGLAGGRSLADQFKLVIGPFQNDFLGPFVIKQPQKRQDAFDEILGIDTWRKTMEGTRSLASTIQAKMDTLQAEVAGKQEQVSVLPAKERELAALLEQRLSKQSELKLKSVDQERLKAAVAALDSQKESIESVQREVQGLEEKIASGKEHIATQQLLVEQARSAAAQLAASAEGKKGYDAAEERLKLLRAQEQAKLLLEKKLAEMEKEQAGLQSTLASETRELVQMREALAADTKRLAGEEQLLGEALADLKRAEAAAGEALVRVNREALLFRELPMHRVENALPYLHVALDRMAAIDAQSLERSKALAGGEALRGEAAELAARQAHLEKIQAERSELAGRKLSLIEGREKIGAGDCPFFHEPCKNLQSGDPSGVFDSRIELIETEVARLDREAAEIAVQVAAAQGAARELAGMTQVALELEKAGRERAELEQEFSRNFRDVAPSALVAPLEGWLDTAGLSGTLAAELKGLDASLAAAPSERREQLGKASDGWRRIIVSLEQILSTREKEAQQPVQVCALKLAEHATRCEALAARKVDLASAGGKVTLREQAIEQHGKRLAALQEAMGEQKGELAVHDGLEKAIKETTEELVRFQPARDSFIANQKSAEELSARQEKLVKYQARLQELDDLLAKKRVEQQGLVAAYDSDRHEAARRERELLLSAVATLLAEIGAIAEGVTRLEGETAALRVVASEIAKKMTAIEDLKEQGVMVKFLRNQVFKNVSSQLSERFREEISFRADRIYRSICESDEELLWGENYQVVLRDMEGGEVRERSDDQLSGGQMMSAVVALRLALLQTIGARIAFFDEPTSNLDAERRENLARAFRAIDVGQEEVTEHWYDQLFLVSHDVSFTEITDQTIQLD